MHREVIAELLRAGRRDLVDVVAKKPAPKQKDDDPVRSTTGRKIRDGIGHLPQFKDMTPDAWSHLGNHVKKYANTTVVFTGALQSLLLWAFQKNQMLPMTRRFGVQVGKLGIDSGVMKSGYGERYIDFLEDGGILEKSTATTKQALKANHTKEDEKNAKERPTTRVAVYSAGEALPGIMALLAKYGARPSGSVIARTVTAAVPGLRINDVDFSSGQEPDDYDDEFATTMMANFTVSEPLLSKMMGWQSRVVDRKLAELNKARHSKSGFVINRLFDSKVSGDILKELRRHVVGLLVDHFDANVRVGPRNVNWDVDSEWRYYDIKNGAITFEVEIEVDGRRVTASTVTAGRRQTVYLGNTGPNGAREWVIVQYRNRPNGNGEKVARVSSRQGREVGPDAPVQWSDIAVMRAYLKNMRQRLSRPGVVLLNKLAVAASTSK